MSGPRATVAARRSQRHIDRDKFIRDESLHRRLLTHHGYQRQHAWLKPVVYSAQPEQVQVIACSCGRILVEYPARPRLKVVGTSRTVRAWDWLPVGSLLWE